MKISVLLSYSVFLPEKFLLINLEIILLVDPIRIFLKISNCPFGAFGIKLSRALSGNGPFAWEFKYTLYLTSSAPFLKKGLSCYFHTEYYIKYIKNIIYYFYINCYMHEY